MRLGQLARKYDISVQEIISYLEEETGEQFHPNAKLYDALESKVYDHFDLQPLSEAEPESDEQVEVENVEPEVAMDLPEPLTEDAAEGVVDDEKVVDIPKVIDVEPPLPATPEEEIAMVEGELAKPEDLHVLKTPEKKEAIPETPEVTIEEKVAHAEDEIIQTDKLLEMLESEDAPAELDKIKLIKAPKRELSGLKVLGKVDLPEPKKKEEKEEKESDIVTEKDLREYRNPRRKRQPLSEEEKEKRRLQAKRKKEEYEARQEKRRKEREEQAHKSRREQHYKQKLEQMKSAGVKGKAKHPDPPAPETPHDSRPEPKTMLGKFWRWMNT
ncbi:MAG: hypothetical protein ABJG47_14805 [Ekhidna sp.]